jgi:hypothetical protein
MQWLQSTFANRFNKLRDARGHLFQGRYKALLVEGGEALAQVCHYIHLNPVRAGIVPAAELKRYRYSSFWFLDRPKERPACLSFSDALTNPNGFPDTAAGWNAYGEYLEWQAAEGPAGRNPSYASLSKGWAIGTHGFKQALLKEHAAAIDLRAWDSDGGQDVRRRRWSDALADARQRLGPDHTRAPSKSAPWKVALARHLKETTDVSNGWLAEQLDMGSPFYVSKHVGRLQRTTGTEAHRLHSRLKVKGKA